MTQETNIVESGRRAYLAGLKPGDCPLANGSLARAWWMKGYREARVKAEGWEDVSYSGARPKVKVP